MTERDAPFEIRGEAVFDCGAWFGSALMDAPFVWSYRNNVKVAGNHRDWFLSPETARSMASALLYFADKAEAAE